MFYNQSFNEKEKFMHFYEISGCVLNSTMIPITIKSAWKFIGISIGLISILICLLSVVHSVYTISFHSESNFSDKLHQGNLSTLV